MKPILVTVASRTKGTKRFIDSLKNINVEYISVEFMPFIDADTAYITYNCKYVGNVKRFNYIPHIDLGEYVLFSDTDDVIFQKNLPDFSNMLKKHDIYIGNERVLHNETIWNDVIKDTPVFSNLLDRTVYNAGLFCMRRNVFNDYVLYMKSKITEGLLSDYADQLLLNSFIAASSYSIYDGIELFCPLYANLDKDFVEKKDEKWVVKKTGELIVAVHSNGIKNRI